MNSLKLTRFEWLLLGLIVFLGVISRFWVETPNFKPIAAFALLSGFVFRRPVFAVVAILLTLLVSDWKLGFYEWPLLLGVYGSFGFCVLLGYFMRRRLGPAIGKKHWLAIVGASLLMSTVFFVVTNGIVWRTSGWYPTDFNGLTQCFVSAVPFFRYTVQADLFFSIVSFATYAVVAIGLRQPAFSSSIRKTDLPVA